MHWSHSDHKSKVFKVSGTFGTGFSDHHKFISTILKLGGFNEKSEEMIYRWYWPFHSTDFHEALQLQLSHLTNYSCDDLETAFQKELNRYAHPKK